MNEADRPSTDSGSLTRRLLITGLAGLVSPAGVVPLLELAASGRHAVDVLVTTQAMITDGPMDVDARSSMTEHHP
jgi:hypothetical protein